MQLFAYILIYAQYISLIDKVHSFTKYLAKEFKINNTFISNIYEIIYEN